MEKYTGYSAHASLAMVGIWMKENAIWEQVEKWVKIRQKVIRHSPTDKLKDLLVNILAGGQAVVEVNSGVRVDKALQLAFGRQGCAEQSTISETLNASGEENVQQMRQALRAIYQRQGAGYRHGYKASCQILDIDLSGLLAGQQAEGASKGYFSGHRNGRGRQLGRVSASRYEEIVCEKLYAGKVQLERNLPELVEMAENTLDLDEKRRKRTVIRMDAGGGTDGNINYLLRRGYFVITKAKNWQRTCKLLKSVTIWHRLPHWPDHEFGWVEAPHVYAAPTRQLAMRWPNPRQPGWCACVLIFNLTRPLIFELAGRPCPPTCSELELISTLVEAYDLRCGAIETSYRNSKQGLGLNKRNKKSFQAQEMLILLAQLAYNLTHWVQQELAPHSHTLAAFGTLRMIRDAFQISGRLEFDPHGQLLFITLNRIHKLAQAFHDYCLSRFAYTKLSPILGEI